MDGCYHIWTTANGGNAMFRWRQCYAKKSTADAAVRRWRQHAPAGGRRPAPSLHIYRVLKCDGPDACPCPCAQDAAAELRRAERAA